jgi:hypothetical protein
MDNIIDQINQNVVGYVHLSVAIGTAGRGRARVGRVGTIP